MIVPEECLVLLKEQRTHMVDSVEYGIELAYTYNTFSQYLPVNAKNIMDIGCGMAGIQVFISAHYDHKIDITLVDKNGVSDHILSGFAKSKDEFSYYHNFEQALNLLKVNNVPIKNIKTCDLFKESFPSAPFDIVISLLSWGFHYPILDYKPNVKPGGIIIADCRNGTNGFDELSKLGKCTIIHQAKKFNRIVCQC